MGGYAVLLFEFAAAPPQNPPRRRREELARNLSLGQIVDVG